MGNKVIGFNFKSKNHLKSASILCEQSYWLDVIKFEDRETKGGVDFEFESAISYTLKRIEGAIDMFCDPVIVEAPTFESELINLINKYSKENESDTPDYILSAFIAGCLKSLELTTRERDKHFGINHKIQNKVTLINE